MPRTVVVLPAHPPHALPPAALPALRAAEVVVADDTLPDDVITAAGASRWAEGPHAYVPLWDEVLLTADADHAMIEHAQAVVVTPPAPAGSALLAAVAVMDRLRSPGGCPWDAEQTHASLLQYLVEECYELYQAIEDGDRDATREELGDVLLQVLFHARIAEGAGDFAIDDIATDLVAKLVRRHPHVFSGTEEVHTVERQEHRWEELKRAEKQRDSSVDGVPLGQPAVALAAKLTSRTARAGLPAALLPAGSGVGEQLFAVAAGAELAGIDPEVELRAAARRFADTVRTAERAAASDGRDPYALDAAAWQRYWPVT